MSTGQARKVGGREKKKEGSGRMISRVFDRVELEHFIRYSESSHPGIPTYLPQSQEDEMRESAPKRP